MIREYILQKKLFHGKSMANKSAFPDFEALFAFDNLSSYSSFALDALLALRMIGILGENSQKGVINRTTKNIYYSP
jgi:hypothetical protein